MESKFIPTLQVGNGYTYLKLKGILDEDNLLANLLSQIQGRLLLIDMAEIERINSCGVRDWVNWLNQIQALGIAVILLRCSPVVVSQANMVANFAADAFIHSFYAPYVHPDTGDEQTVLIFTEDIRQNQPIHAPKIFNENGEELEFDEFEESYFAFISDPRIMNYQVSPDVQSVIQYFLPESASRQPVVGQRSLSGSMSFGNAVSQPAQQMHSQQAGYGPQAAYAQQSPYSGMMNGTAGTQNGMGMQRQAGYGQPYGQGNPGYGAPQAQPMVPQPAQPVRHEQPPIPSSSGYQQIPSGLPNQQQQGRMPQAGTNGLFSSNKTEPIPAHGTLPAPAPAPVPESPKPAPQPVSSLAMQSMARTAPNAQNDADVPKQNTNNAAPNAGYRQGGYQQQDCYFRGGNQMTISSMSPDMVKQRKVFYIIAITVVILVIILVAILCVKCSS